MKIIHNQLKIKYYILLKYLLRNFQVLYLNEYNILNACIIVVISFVLKLKMKLIVKIFHE